MGSKKAQWKGTVQSRGEVNPLLKEPGDTVLVYRGHPRLLLMLCPCGCGEQIVLNIDPQAGPAWRIYQKKSNAKELTVYPSVWRDTGCGSHFIIWQGHILGIGYDSRVKLDKDLLENVLKALTKQFQRYENISTNINENPWSVLWACQQLTKQGLAVSMGKDELFAKI